MQKDILAFCGSKNLQLEMKKAFSDGLANVQIVCKAYKLKGKALMTPYRF